LGIKVFGSPKDKLGGIRQGQDFLKVTMALIAIFYFFTKSKKIQKHTLIFALGKFDIHFSLICNQGIHLEILSIVSIVFSSWVKAW
jgi:hypothetical protein